MTTCDEAYRHHVQTNEDNFLFRSPLTGAEWSASFTRFPNSFGQPWQVVNLTPTDDFVGALEAANRQMVAIIVVLTALELIADLLCIDAARTTDRNRLAGTEIGRSHVFRRLSSSKIQYRRNRPASVRRRTAAHLAAVIFLVCAFGCGAGADQVRNSAVLGCRIAFSDRIFL